MCDFAPARSGQTLERLHMQPDGHERITYAMGRSRSGSVKRRISSHENKL